MDVPPPATPDEVAAAFDGPLYTLATQPTVEEAAVSTVGRAVNGGPVAIESATLSYTLWRNPADRSDPSNLAPLSDELRASLDAEPQVPLPDWMLQIRERMRYPWLWDAVRTTRYEVVGRPPVGLQRILLDHVVYILRNRFREERMRRSAGDHGPGELLGEPTVRAVETGIPVLVDGVETMGVHLDTDAHVLGVGAELGDRVLTAVVPRAELGLFRVEFATRRGGSGGG